MQALSPDRQSAPARRKVPHQLALKNRERLSVEGVLNVDSFDPREILLQIEGGVLTIRGEGLQIRELNVETAALVVEGQVRSLEYGGEGPAAKGRGLLARLFR